MWARGEELKQRLFEFERKTQNVAKSEHEINKSCSQTERALNKSLEKHTHTIGTVCDAKQASAAGGDGRLSEELL